MSRQVGGWREATGGWVAKTHFTATPPALRSTKRQEEKKGRLPSINTGLFTSSGPFACNSNSVSNKSEYLLTLHWLRNVRWKVHRPSNKRARGSKQKRRGEDQAAGQMRKPPEPAAATRSPLPSKMCLRFSSSTPSEGHFLC